MRLLLKAARSAATRRLAPVTALACGMLAIAAPAAFANHVGSVTANGCSSITFNYVDFAVNYHQTVTMTLLDADGTTVNNTGTGSFVGPNGSTTIPVVGGYNGEVIIPQSNWITKKGVPTSYNTTKPYTTVTLSCPPTFTGYAYNLNVTGPLATTVGLLVPLPVNPVPASGPYSSTSPYSNSSTILNENVGPLTGTTLTSGLVAGGETSTASTSVQNLGLASVLGLPGISATAVDSTSQTVCSPSTGVDTTSGSTTIDSLNIGGTIIAVPTGPITTPVVIPIPLVGTVTLGEQIPVVVGGKTVGLTENAIDVYVSLLNTHVIIGSATSNVEGC